MDSLKRDYQNKIDFIQSLNQNPRSEKTEITKEWKQYFYKIDKLLATYTESPKYLVNDDVAKIVADSMMYFDKEEYYLSCYCIMSNHVHLVIQLLKNSRTIDRIMQSIKSYSASKCNELLRRRGQFWQHENYDHIIRDEAEFERIVQYVLNNPVKAGLVEKQDDWKWNYLAKLDM